jgi:hypothetical protein
VYPKKITWVRPVRRTRAFAVAGSSNSRELLGLARRGRRGTLVAFASCFSVNSTNTLCGAVDMRLFSKKVACLCLLLTFWSALAFAAHHHSSATEAVKCTVCIAAHSASPKAPSTLLKATFVAVSTFLAEPLSAKQRLITFALCVRPPPSV